MAITILVTDKNLAVVGDPIECWSSVDCTLRFNEVGSGMFSTPAYPWIREQLDASHRVVVIRDRKIFLAGPIEEFQIEQSDDGENSGVGTLTVNFADDLSLVAARHVYPDPAHAPEDWTDDLWEFTGNAEVGLQNLVNLNAGPGALAARRVPRLALADLTGVGSTITVTSQLELLGETARRIALAGGGLGFRTQQVGTQIMFETYLPEDKSGSVRFGFGLGNLRYLAVDRKAPVATTALVGGQGEGADRAMIERTDAVAEAAWLRRETLVSRLGTDPLEDLQKAGDDELLQQGETIRLQTSAWDTPDQRYGEHYDLGTKVSVAIDRGEQVSDLVRQVHLQAWATAGELLSAMVGTQEASNDPAWVKRIAALEKRARRIERTYLPATP